MEETIAKSLTKDFPPLKEDQITSNDTPAGTACSGKESSRRGKVQPSLAVFTSSKSLFVKFSVTQKFLASHPLREVVPSQSFFFKSVT